MFLTKDKTLYALVIHKIRLGCVWLRRGGRGACEMIVEERDQHIERQLVQWRKFKTRAESQSANTGRPVHRTRRWTQQSLMRFGLITRSTFLINSWTVISWRSMLWLLSWSWLHILLKLFSCLNWIFKTISVFGGDLSVLSEKKGMMMIWQQLSGWQPKRKLARQKL